MKTLKIATSVLVLVAVAVSLAGADVWEQDRNGSFYIWRKENGKDKIFRYPLINREEQPITKFDAPGTAAIAVDPTGNVFSLRDVKRGNRHILKVYKDEQTFSVSGVPFEVDIGRWPRSHTSDIGVSQNIKSGDRVYVYTTVGGKGQLHYLSLPGMKAPKTDKNFAGGYGSTVKAIAVNSYSSKKDFVQLYNNKQFQLQALWSPLDGQQGTTGYLHRMVSYGGSNRIYRVPTYGGLTNNTKLKRAEVAFNDAVDRSDAFADYVAGYNPNLGRGLSFMSANARGQSGNNTIYNMLNDTALDTVKSTRFSWGNNWATLGSGSSIKVHMAAPSIIAGTQLIVYEPVLKLNPNAIREGEIKDANGDNYDDWGYQRDDYVAMDYKATKFNLKQASGRKKTYSFRTLDYVTGKRTGPRMYLTVDGTLTGNQDEIIISMQNAGRIDSGNLLAIEAEKSSIVKLEYYGVSGSDQNGSPGKVDKNENEVGDVWSLRRTYGYYKTTSGQNVTLGRGRQKVKKERETYYSLFQDRNLTGHKFHIGITKYEQTLTPISCGCRGMRWGPMKETSTPQSPILDMAVVNIGMPPHVKGQVETDILFNDKLTDGALLINEDGYYSSDYGGGWAFENYGGPLGSLKDMDMDNRAGGFSTAFYSDKNDPYWGMKRDKAREEWEKNPIFSWKVRQVEPDLSEWKLVNTGPEFKPADKYVFRDGGIYQVKLELDGSMMDWASLTYPPLYWESSGTMDRLSGMDSLIDPQTGEDPRTDIIEVVARAKPPTTEPGDLKVTFYNTGQSKDYPSSFNYASIEEDIEVMHLYQFKDDDQDKDEDEAKLVHLNLPMAIYQVPWTVTEKNAFDKFAGHLRLSGAQKAEFLAALNPGRSGAPEENPGSGKVSVAPKDIDDEWFQEGNVDDPLEHFTGIVYEEKYRPTLSVKITPAYVEPEASTSEDVGEEQNKKQEHHFFNLSEAVDIGAEESVHSDDVVTNLSESGNGLTNKTTPPCFEQEWPLFLRNYMYLGETVTVTGDDGRPEEVLRSDVEQGVSVLPRKAVVADWLTPYPDQGSEPAVAPRLSLSFNTPLEPDHYSVIVTLKYHKQYCDGAQVRIGDTLSWVNPNSVDYTKDEVVKYSVGVKPLSCTARFNVTVTDRTNPVVKLLGGNNDDGSFVHEGTRLTEKNDQGQDVETEFYTDITSLSGATTGDSWARTDKLKLVVLDNNPKFGDTGNKLKGRHYARFLYPDPKTEKWKIYECVVTEESAADANGNAVCARGADDGTYRNGQFQSRTEFTIDKVGSADDFIMPGDKLSTAYYAIGCDGSGNSGKYTLALVDDTIKSNPLDITEDVDCLVDNAAAQAYKFSTTDPVPGTCRSGKDLQDEWIVTESVAENDVEEIADPAVDGGTTSTEVDPYASGEIEVWDNDPPNLKIEIGTGVRRQTVKINISSLEEPAKGTDAMLWNGVDAHEFAGEGDVAGFEMEVVDELGNTMYETSATIPETDFYYDRFPLDLTADVGENMVPWRIDIDDYLVNDEEPSGSDFKIKVVEKARFELSVRAFDNTVPNKPVKSGEEEVGMELNYVELSKDEVNELGGIPANLELDPDYNARLQHGNDELIATPFYYVFRSPSKSGDDFLEISVKDNCGNRRIVRIPIEVVDTKMRVHTLQTQSSFSSGVSPPGENTVSGESEEGTEEAAGGEDGGGE